MVKKITVIAKMKESGEVEPLSLIWEDCREFKIDRILETKRKASTKGGGMGLRYKVRILNKEKFLFLDEYFWFIEI